MTATATMNGHTKHTDGTAAKEPAGGNGSGRDADGRFAKGNTLGCGNPFARLVAGLRQRAVQRVTPAVLDEIMDTLIVLARGGDLGAIKLLLGYTLGKPAEVANPDALDLEEWRARAQAPPLEEAEAVMNRMPLEMVTGVANALDMVQWQMYREEVDKLPDGKPAPKKRKAGPAPAGYSPRSIGASRLTAGLNRPPAAKKKPDQRNATVPPPDGCAEPGGGRATRGT